MRGGRGECGSGGRWQCDKSYEGPRCDVWRSEGGVATSLAGLLDLRWHNCTHDASLTQRCTRENSTLCEHAGAPPPDETTNFQRTFEATELGFK